jgi:hypothetical protein
MGRFILKPDRDVDFYVEWSTIVENVTAMGTRTELAKLLHEYCPGDGAAERFDRADQTGSSATWGDSPSAPYGWDDEYLMAEQRLLPRAKLREYAEAVNAGDLAAALALTEPPEDDEA